MNKFTPGPWRLHPENIPYVICGDDGPSFGIITYAGSMDEMMADARLLAAAPALYEALKAMVGAIELDATLAPMAVIQARAALALAEAAT